MNTKQPYTHVGPGLPPLYGAQAKALILGSFPSPKSRTQGFYYGHPQNRFWPLMATLTHSPTPAWEDLDAKRAIIIGSGLAVWDVIHACSIRGASDASIKDVEPNDLAALVNRLGVQAIFCNGATSADSATPTLIYDAKLEIHSPRGVRFVPINGFHTGPGKVSLEHDEILVAFHFPPQPKEHAGSAHFKYAMRDAMDISTIGCAAHCRLDNGNFSELRLAFGVAAPTPIRCQHAEQTAQNAPLNLQTLEAISESVLQDVAPRSSWRASKEFRLHLIQTMTKKVISEAVAAAGGKLQ